MDFWDSMIGCHGINWKCRIWLLLCHFFFPRNVSDESCQQDLLSKLQAVLNESHKTHDNWPGPHVWNHLELSYPSKKRYIWTKSEALFIWNLAILEVANQNMLSKNYSRRQENPDRAISTFQNQFIFHCQATSIPSAKICGVISETDGPNQRSHISTRSWLVKPLAILQDRRRSITLSGL